MVLLTLLWVRSGDWVNRDAQIYEFNHELWNSVMVFPFAVIALLAMFIPAPIGLSLMLVAWAAPFIAYVVHHNKSVEAHQTVFTAGWWRFQLAEFGKRFGLKLGGEKKADYLRGPDVDLAGRGGEDDRANQANLLTARQSPGYVHVKELIADLVGRGASRALLDYGAEAVTLRYMIDGVWHSGDPRDRESGDVMLAVMKQLANLDTERAQEETEGRVRRGLPEEEVRLHRREPGREDRRAGRGLAPRRQPRRRVQARSSSSACGRSSASSGSISSAATTGVIVYSALPEGGLTTLTDVGMLETDRLMRDFVSVEDLAHPETDIENIASHYYDAAKGESPSKLIPSLSRKYPSVWVVRDFVDAETAKLLMDEVDLDRLVITTVQAGDVAEACLRLLKQKTPHKEFCAGRDRRDQYTRLIRKLCPACRVEYDASPNAAEEARHPGGQGERSSTVRPPPRRSTSRAWSARGWVTRAAPASSSCWWSTISSARSCSRSPRWTSSAKRPAPPACGRSKRRASCSSPRGRLPCKNSNASSRVDPPPPRHTLRSPPDPPMYNIFFGIVVFAAFAMTVQQGVWSNLITLIAVAARRHHGLRRAPAAHGVGRRGDRRVVHLPAGLPDSLGDLRADRGADQRVRPDALTQSGELQREARRLSRRRHRFHRRRSLLGGLRDGDLPLCAVRLRPDGGRLRARRLGLRGANRASTVPRRPTRCGSRRRRHRVETPPPWARPAFSSKIWVQQHGQHRKTFQDDERVDRRNVEPGKPLLLAQQTLNA